MWLKTIDPFCSHALLSLLLVHHLEEFKAKIKLQELPENHVVLVPSQDK